MDNNQAKEGKGKLLILLVAIGCLGLLGALALCRSEQAPGASTETNAGETNTGIHQKTTPPQAEELHAAAETQAPLQSENERSVEEIKAEAIEEQRQRIMRKMQEFSDNPGVNHMIVQQQRILMAEKYRDLIRSLGLNDEEAEYFMDLMLARQMLHVGFGMKLMTGMVTPEEREQLVQKLQEDVAPINTEVDYFLNHAEDSEYLKYYEQTELQRSAVNAIKSEAQRDGISISDDVGEQLVGVIYEELGNHSFSVQLEPDGNPDFSKFTDDNINLLITELNALAPSVLQRASDLLDPNQLALFQKAYAAYVNAERNRLLMMKQLF